MRRFGADSFVVVIHRYAYSPFCLVLTYDVLGELLVDLFWSQKLKFMGRGLLFDDVSTKADTFVANEDAWPRNQLFNVFFGSGTEGAGVGLITHICLFFDFGMQYLVDDPIFLSLLWRHEKVSVRVCYDPIDRLAGQFAHNCVKPLFEKDDFFRL